MSDVYQQSVEYHRQHKGKLGVQSLVSVKNRDDLSLAYTPGVAEACRVIAKDPAESFELTMRGRTVAVVSDGSAVLGLGNIGAAAAMPVMEGKSLLMREFAGVDSIPLVIDTQETSQIIEFVKQVAPSFVGINLEDIAAPRCFEVEDALQEIGIPVFHDDQHGTAIVVTAALHNAAKVAGKNFADLKVVMVGAGAAGLATAKMLLGLDGPWTALSQLPDIERVAQLKLVDTRGVVYPSRPDVTTHHNRFKAALLPFSNTPDEAGDLAAALVGADVLIGVSGPNLVTAEMVKNMAPGAIVFAMANPTPEILPDLAHQAGAVVVATGRSDFANQVNNVLAFPGVFRAVIKARLPRITTQMKYAAAHALAQMVPDPTATSILPDPFQPELAEKVADAIIAAQ
ncbi:NADP-dependent malic enzyme [Patescibacteria group bacterium]|nr:NADP-dependent malic enzyme [Patescibacteria group bacterium]